MLIWLFFDKKGRFGLSIKLFILKSFAISFNFAGEIPDAKSPPITAPMDVPTIISGVNPFFWRTLRIPMWVSPLEPPPIRTKAHFGFFFLKNPSIPFIIIILYGK